MNTSSATQKNQFQTNVSEDVMPNDGDGRRAPRDVSRRHLFKQVGFAGAAAAVSATAPGVVTAAAQPAAVPATPTAPKPEVLQLATPTAVPRLEALETLTAAEADTLEAIVARLIPSDENGPGATEARAAHYIDRALTGPLRTSRAAYAANLAAIDVYAQSKKGAPFAKLPAAHQDSVLVDMEKNVATGFTPNAAAFFTLVRTHTIQGTFCDPYYGGNANFVGWDLIGYPGIRLAVTADDQRMKVRAKPERASAYADASFSMTGATKGGGHGHRP
jgi:gluconate 2-dehydrogenase gamma chain